MWSDQTINIENDIDQIKYELNINKENEAERDNVLTEHASPLMNNSPHQLLNLVA